MLSNDAGTKNEPTDKNDSPAQGGVAAPAITLPKGGGAIRGMGEKFAANPVTGTGSMTVPIVISPGRSGFDPQLSLSYDSGAGNGPFGLGWSLALPAITRKTDKGLPRYRDAEASDEFMLSGAEDLVPVLVEQNGRWERKSLPPRRVHGKTYRVERYRPRVEGLFAGIERWTNSANEADCCWRVIGKDNVATWYGKTAESRVFDPSDPARIYSWLICESHDDKGNVIVYEYVPEDSRDVDTTRPHEANRTGAGRAANRYLKSIRYGNRTPYFPVLAQGGAPTPLPAATDWLFEVVFDYGEHDAAAPTPGARGVWPRRRDPFSSYRAGFEVRTYRLCQRVLMFHHFDNEPDVGRDCLVRSTDFTYAYEQDPTDPANPIHSVLAAVTQSGYRREIGGYLQKSLPPLEFTYSQAVIDESLREVEADSLENLPQGLDGTRYQWVDLDGEGVSGVLTEQGEAWYFKRNLSPSNSRTEQGRERTLVKLGPLERVAAKPSPGTLGGGQTQLLDLAGDGQLDVVTLSGPAPGFFERTEYEDWDSFRQFTSLPVLDWSDPNLRFVDLTGDGHADVLITEDNAFAWYPSLAEAGFGAQEAARQALDEEQGPRLVFADGAQAIYLADMSGDGLTDLVRIRNGEVCYWPNLGYARFGAKVTMDDAPWFDAPDQFDQTRIRLADIDGSGITDILYLRADGVSLYFNHSGNGWSKGRLLTPFPIDDASSVTVTDLLGNGTACLLWSTPLPGEGRRPMRYLDLMGGRKPHLLIGSSNNLGAETAVHYAPSTKFYVADKLAGRAWITKVPFPVHAVERIETYDHVSGNRFVTRYAYHHGYFDGMEREFRGFGMVEQWDTEVFQALAGDLAPAATNVDRTSHVAPILTRTWFHTGAYLGRDRISNFFAGLHDADDRGEYYREPGLIDAQARARLLDDTVLPAGLPLEDEREACRALKGSMLRQEVYALDGPGTAEHPHGHPYTVTEQNFAIRRLQPKGDNRHGVFFAHPHETLTYRYERNPADPRMNHALTLEVDATGNVLKSLTVGYGRRAGQSPLGGDDRLRQERMLITYTENDVTNAVADAAVYPDAYRTAVPYESRTYEVTGLALPANAQRFAFADFAANNFQALTTLAEIGYEQSADLSKKQKRLIERVRTLYRRDDLSALLPKGVLEPLALYGESYRLAFTPGLLDRLYVRGGQRLLPANVADVLAGGGPERGGYVDLDGDGHWWAAGGLAFYSADAAHTAAQERAQARQHFYVMRRYRSPFHAAAFDTDTVVDYDAYDLLLLETRDALGNRITVGTRRPDDSLDAPGNDYRVLQPRRVMDANRNVAEVVFDALGFVAATAVSGKPEDSPPQGERLAPGFNADPTPAQLDAFYGASDPHTPAPALLGSATTRFVYDLHRFQRSRTAHPNDSARWEPVYAATLARETHASDPAPAGGVKVQVSFSYSDGYGREIQRKVQAEPGPVPRRDALGRILVGADGRPQPTATAVAPRWVGSGWVVYDNKGNPVRQFEPFFSDTHRPDFDVRAGASPVLFYDPLGRVICTLQPNHAWEKVVFDPWRQRSFDANDTLHADPRTDPDVQGYVRNYFAAQPPGWQTWLQQRLADPSQPPPDTGGADPERDAAVRALAHADTPTLVHFDALGRPFLTVTDHGPDAGGNPRLYETRLLLDIEGNSREASDARQRRVARYDYDMLATRSHQASMDAGARWMLHDASGKVLRAWDDRGHAFHTDYDRLRRPVRQRVRGSDAVRSDPRVLDRDVLFERTEYGEGQPGDSAGNLRTRVYRQYDGAGIMTNEAYDFKGNLLRNVRELAPGYKDVIDWAAAQPAGERFTSRTAYDALNRPVTMTAPDDSVIRPRYNEANLLDALQVNLRGAAAATAFVDNIDYDAKGQRTRVDYATRDGAGITTTYRYDPLTLRLVQLTTRRHGPGYGATDRPGEVQNFRYTYDPAGNITDIRDTAQPTVYFSGQVVDAHNTYVYDADYRLIAATGREHRGQPPRPWSTYNDAGRVNLAHPHDGQAMRRYTERYEYDEVGNFLRVLHQAANGNWTRTYGYGEASLLQPGVAGNRLSATVVDGTTETYSTNGDGYDAHGNLRRSPHLQILQWGFEDQLLLTQRQAVSADDDEGSAQQGERTYYVYDAGGRRVRKVTERANGTVRKERLYVAGFERYREYDGNADVALERETLHVMDDKQRVALVETKTRESGWLNTIGRVFTGPETVIRYQLANHAGASVLELDADARIVSYEEYTPYGATSYQAVRGQTDAPKRYRHAAKERDEESGLYYHGARYYAPWLGRWISCDPVLLSNQSALYTFASCNPVTHVDVGGEYDPAAFGKSLEAKVTQAEEALLVEDRNIGTSLVNTGIATGATVVRGFFSILQVGTGAAQGVEDIKRGLSDEGDGWDIAIGASRILSDAGEVASASLGVAGNTTKVARVAKAAKIEKEINTLRKQATNLERRLDDIGTPVKKPKSIPEKIQKDRFTDTRNRLNKVSEEIGEKAADKAAVRAGLKDLGNPRRLAKGGQTPGQPVRQGIDKVYGGKKPFAKERAVVVEAKANLDTAADATKGVPLKTDKRNLTQGSVDWINDRLDSAVTQGLRPNPLAVDIQAGLGSGALKLESFAVVGGTQVGASSKVFRLSGQSGVPSVGRAFGFGSEVTTMNLVFGLNGTFQGFWSTEER